ncbi:MAG: glycosyltransferase family 39 protein [Planctomycetaceae bacterium]
MTRRRTFRREAPAANAGPASFDPPIRRWEWIAVVAIVLIAAALRLAFAERMAVEHFDEGVYASNIFFGPEEDRRYPYRHLYAPPLLPWLIELCMLFLGTDGIAPFLPALVLGTATIPLAWWTARCWFGPPAGLAAAGLVATSDFHLLYSRTALTDVPVTFFMLLAVYLYWEAVRRGSIDWSLAAGIATGLAWWTKYTGWLPLAIAAAGSLAWLLFERQAGGVSLSSRAWTIAKCFFTTAITACLVWSPVLIGLQEFGGYAAVTDNHRRFLQPWSQWLDNLWQQAGNIAAQSGGLTVVGLALLAGAIPLRTGWPGSVRALLAVWCAVVAGWTTFRIGPALPLLLLVVVGVATVLLVPLRSPEAPAVEKVHSQRRLAAWLIAAWFCGLLATTPFYHPYPRLAIPWLLAALLGVSVWLAESKFSTAAAWTNRRSELFPAVMLVLPLTVAAAILHERPWWTFGWTVPGWQARTDVAAAGRRFANAVRHDARNSERPVLVDVHAQPALFYYLASELAPERINVMPNANLAQILDPRPDMRRYLCAGNMRTADFPLIAKNEAWRATHLIPVDETSIRPSPLVQLDNHRIRPFLLERLPRQAMLFRLPH